MNLFDKYHIEKNGIKFAKKKMCRCGQVVSVNENICPHCGLSLKRNDLIYKTYYRKQIRFEKDESFRAYILNINFVKEEFNEYKVCDVPLNISVEDIWNERKTRYFEYSSHLFGNTDDKRALEEQLFQYIEDNNMNIHYEIPEHITVYELIKDIILYNINPSFFQYENTRCLFFRWDFLEMYNLLTKIFNFNKDKLSERYILYIGTLGERKDKIEPLSFQLTLEEQEQFMTIYDSFQYRVSYYQNKIDLYNPKETLRLCHTWFDNPMGIKKIISLYMDYTETETSLYKIPEDGLTPQFMTRVINNWGLVKKLHISVDEADIYLKNLHDKPMETFIKMNNLLKQNKEVQNT